MSVNNGFLSINSNGSQRATPIATPDPRTLHKPTDAATLRREAINLASRGLTHRDIACLMELTEQAVRQLLSLPTDPNAAKAVTTQETLP